MRKKKKNRVGELQNKKYIILQKKLATTSSGKYYQINLDVLFKTARELFLILASPQYDLTPPGNSMKGKTEDKLALYLCNADAVLRAAVTGAFASLKS
jgi:hypothetical protein